MEKFYAFFKYQVICLLLSGAVFANTIDVLPLMNSKSSEPNRVWVGTFQLVWNDFMDNIVKGPVQFKRKRSTLAKALNKRSFTSNELSENAYYKVSGEVSLDLRKKIESEIRKKFNEKSDILGSINWVPEPGKYLVYAMLKKDFKFAVAFDKLKPENGLQYFGITPKSSEAVREQVSVLFYNSKADFAVKIRTAGSFGASGVDEVYLYRTDSDENFEKLYERMLSVPYDGFTMLLPKDELKVPDINMYVFKSFDELTGHKIKGTDGLMISDAMETIEFKMNNSGVKLKSEAAIVTTRSAIALAKPRLFYFDNTFVLFLKERGKDKPYFALRVADPAVINKTGRK